MAGTTAQDLTSDEFSSLREVAKGLRQWIPEEHEKRLIELGLIEPIVLKNIATPLPIKDYLWEMHKRIAQDKSNSVFGESDATHLQEQVGYTKNNRL